MKASEMEPNHLLLIGGVWGALTSLRDNEYLPTEVESVVDGDEMTNEFLIKRSSGTYRVVVEAVE